MFMHKKMVCGLIAAALVTACATPDSTTSPTPTRGPNLGVTPSAAMLAAMDTSIPPSGAGLPAGSGTVAQGEKVYAAKCETCHGPKGAGALFIRSPLLPDPVQFGGAHENERRAGTENLPAIIGFTDALERFVRVPVFDRSALAPLTERLLATIEAVEGAHFRGSR